MATGAKDWLIDKFTRREFLHDGEVARSGGERAMMFLGLRNVVAHVVGMNTNSEDRPKSNAGPVNGFRKRSLITAAPDNGAQEMREFWDNLEDVASRAKQHYNSIETELERDHFGEWVSFDADTGGYVFGESRRAACENFKARFGKDTPSWSTRVGMPAIVGFTGGPLHPEGEPAH